VFGRVIEVIFAFLKVMYPILVTVYVVPLSSTELGMTMAPS
jgi:hypothetical protein